VTCDPAVIRHADKAGVDRIGIDIERMGKHLRQGNRPGYRISDHELDDLATVVSNVTNAEIFVRFNPLHPDSQSEIDRALDLGAQVVMLPSFTEPREAARFVKMVGGRAKPILLVETAAAAARISEFVAIEGVTEVMVGLNDLHISLGWSNPFEVMTSDLIVSIAAHVREAGIRFGVGGLARAEDSTLPVSPDLVYAQYPRLGATAAWLARSFYSGINTCEIPFEVRKLNERLAYWFAQPVSALTRQRDALATKIRDFGEQMR